MGSHRGLLWATPSLYNHLHNQQYEDGKVGKGTHDEEACDDLDGSWSDKCCLL